MLDIFLLVLAIIHSFGWQLNETLFRHNMNRPSFSELILFVDGLCRSLKSKHCNRCSRLVYLEYPALT